MQAKTRILPLIMPWTSLICCTSSAGVWMMEFVFSFFVFFICKVEYTRRGTPNTKAKLFISITGAQEGFRGWEKKRPGRQNALIAIVK
uniref:Putative secreted peptide n=1 Tax=Anopheles braziliensis TaxID=58242 RepID=A0A2M3ZTW3_9DIPT